MIIEICIEILSSKVTIKFYEELIRVLFFNEVD